MMEDIKQDPEYLGADVEDIGDLLKKIEKSYNIAFEKDELKPVRTFGELCDIIIGKINLIDTNDCTRQQAFYKLREAIISNANIESTHIKTEARMTSLFPKRNRNKVIKKLEKELGFELKILQPNTFFGILGIGLLISSFLLLFYHWEYSIIGFIITTIYIIIINKTGKEFRAETVGELVEIMTWEHYLASRRNPQTINKKEIVREIEKMFIKHLMTDLKKINRETIIVD